MKYKKGYRDMRKQKEKKEPKFDWSDFEKEAIDRLKNGEKFGEKDDILASRCAIQISLTIKRKSCSC